MSWRPAEGRNAAFAERPRAGRAWLPRQGLLHTFASSIVIFVSDDFVILRTGEFCDCAIAVYERR
jgi:hypothetical protein